MRKILLSLALITLTIAAVGSSAYALFSDTVKVQGITLSTGQADLKLNGTLDKWDTPVTYGGFKPGDIEGLNFTLNNKSVGNFGLDLTAKLTSAGGDWGVLSDKLYARILKGGVDKTGWQKLSQWYASPLAFDTDMTGDVGYRVELYVDSNAGNEIAGKTLSNINLDIVGTQH